MEPDTERFPHLTMKALVRGGEVLNDATADDAAYVGLDNIAEIISNGDAIAGTVSDPGRHIFYEFLCKCDLLRADSRFPD